MEKNFLSDEEIVRRFFSNERSRVCATFFERFDSRIKKMIRDLVLQTDEAKDFYQEVVFHLMSVRPDQYTEIGKFYGWLHKVIHNLYLSKMKNEHRVFDTMEYEFRLSENNWEKREKLCNLVIEKIALLTDIQQRTIHMVFYEGLSQKEICEREGISLNTHNKRLSKAKKNLDNCWKKAESLKFSKIDRFRNA